VAPERKREPGGNERSPGGRWRFGEGICFVGKGFILLMEVVEARAGAHLCRRVSGANTAGYWVGKRTGSPGGDNT